MGSEKTPMTALRQAEAERDAREAENARLREGLDRIERLNLDHGGCYSAAIQRELEALAVPPSASQEKP